jgi:hypothetical protein
MAVNRSLTDLFLLGDPLAGRGPLRPVPRTSSTSSTPPPRPARQPARRPWGGSFRVPYDGETLQAVEDWEFQPRTGFEPDEARALMDRIADVLLAAGHWQVIP